MMRIHARSVRKVVLGSGVTLVLCVPLAVSVAASAANAVLISQGAAAIASSALARSAASAALDADLTSRWESDAGPGTEWLRVDLGAVREIDRVRLGWGKA